MRNVGAWLRTARETRGTTLAEAAAATRIGVEYLAGLEDGQPPDAFPGASYARLFLRTYARFLGLDAVAVLDAYEAEHEPAGPSRFGAIPDGAVLPEGTRSHGYPTRVVPSTPATSTTRRAVFSGSGVRELARGRRRRAGGVIARVPPQVTGPARRTVTRDARRRRLTRLAVVATTTALLAAGLVHVLTGSAHAPAVGDAGVPAVPASLQLPRGGREIFPRFRVVAFFGAPRTTALGVLGAGPDVVVPRLQAQANAYATPRRPVLPAMELVATVASGVSEDGTYRVRVDAPTIDAYLAAARRAHMLLILDVQPGRSDFVTEVERYRSYLEQPDVGLAIDPEWHVGPTEVPGRSIGSVDAATVNRLSAWLAGIVLDRRLPQKLFVIHRFTIDMVRDSRAILARPELAMTFDVDGVGDAPNKTSKYDLFARNPRTPFFNGIKLYYGRDTGLMQPAAVESLRPAPDLVVYQ